MNKTGCLLLVKPLKAFLKYLIYTLAEAIINSHELFLKMVDWRRVLRLISSYSQYYYMTLNKDLKHLQYISFYLYFVAQWLHNKTMVL